MFPQLRKKLDSIKYRLCTNYNSFGARKLLDFEVGSTNGLRLILCCYEVIKVFRISYAMQMGAHLFG